MKSFPTVVLSLLLALFLLSGCGSSGIQDYEAYAPDEENRLIIYTSHRDSVYLPLIREFEERTGIWVQVETGGTRELLERIAAGEDDPSCDLLLGGGIDTLGAYSELFSPYESSLLSSVREDCRNEDGTWTALSLLPVVLIYNSKLVRINPPTSWQDLLDEAWRGEIAFADPNISGSAYTTLVTMLTALAAESGTGTPAAAAGDSGEIPAEATELLRSFAENLDGTIFPLSGSVIEQVSNGNFYIGVTLEDDALRAVQEGFDIAIVIPGEGTAVIPDGMAVIAGCAHEENARKFIDFALGADVQSYLADQCARRSVREDISPENSRLPAVSSLPYDMERAIQCHPALLEQWNEILKEVTP